MPSVAAPPDTAWARRPLAVAAREFLLLGLLRPFTFFYNRPKVHGRHALRSVQGPLLFAANHASHLDTPVIMCALPGRLRRRTSAVAAADYFFRKRLVGWGVALLFATLPIERSGLSDVSSARVARLVEEGWSILMFPEGTRSPSGKLGRLRSGAARMATTYGIPIVPVYLTGTFESHPKGSDWPRFRRVTVRFGAPLPPPAGGDVAAMTEAVRHAFADLARQAGRSEP